MQTLSVVSIVFIAISLIFLVISFRDYLRYGKQKTIARKVRLRMAIIFAAVGIGLYFLKAAIN
jgi:hypothetical protein